MPPFRAAGEASPECGALGLCELPKGHDGMHSTSVDRAAELDALKGYLVFEGPNGELMRTPYRALRDTGPQSDGGLAARTYVPTPDDLDQLCAAISSAGYASEAVEIVEDWTRQHWGVESAFTSKVNAENAPARRGDRR